MNCYVIIQVGVYRHSLGYVSTSLGHAVEAARLACVAEEDDYHQWQVYAVPINGPVNERNETAVGEWKRRDKRAEGNRRTSGEPAWTWEPSWTERTW